MVLKLNYLKNKLAIIVWGAMIFSYYFQAPFKHLAQYIVPLLFVYLILNKELFHTNRLKHDTDKLLLIFIFYVIFSSFWTLLFGGITQKVMRFAMILIALPLCFFMKKENFTWEYKIFIILSIAKAIYLAFIAIQMEVSGTYIPARRWAQENGFGDAYFVYDIVPRVQLHGNALLVTSFVLNFHKDKRFNISNIVLLIGVLIEGNFSFVIGLILLFLYEHFSTTNVLRMNLAKIAMTLLLSIVSIAFLFYANLEMTRKANWGNALKMKQAAILVDTNLIIGDGVGAIVPRNTELGRKTDADYYELQALYIFYQIGLIGIILFYVLTFYMCSFYGKTVFSLYVIYLIYSAFNPYCFDTTHMMTTILLINCARNTV